MDETYTIISITTMCQQFNQLPNEGGLLNQDQLYVRKMQMVIEEQALRRQKDEAEKSRRGNGPGRARPRRHR